TDGDGLGAGGFAVTFLGGSAGCSTLALALGADGTPAGTEAVGVALAVAGGPAAAGVEVFHGCTTYKMATPSTVMAKAAASAIGTMMLRPSASGGRVRASPAMEVDSRGGAGVTVGSKDMGGLTGTGVTRGERGDMGPPGMSRRSSSAYVNASGGRAFGFLAIDAIKR